jgi:mono/diheme cytochrome c family protein
MKPLLNWSAVFLLPVVVCGGLYLLGREVSLRNREWPTQMQYSPAYLSQTSNPVLPNRSTAQMPVDGTLARGQQAFHYGASEAENLRAGVELKNPFAPTPENLARGHYIFSNYCAVCHGAGGGGDGAIIPKYPNPPSYKTVTSRNLPDGAMFHVITLGRKDMPSHAAQVAVADRWKVILYIRTLQNQ